MTAASIAPLVRRVTRLSQYAVRELRSGGSRTSLPTGDPGDARSMRTLFAPSVSVAAPPSSNPRAR